VSRCCGHLVSGSGEYYAPTVYPLRGKMRKRPRLPSRLTSPTSLPRSVPRLSTHQGALSMTSVPTVPDCLNGGPRDRLCG
jgi:hypothetical protein